MVVRETVKSGESGVLWFDAEVVAEVQELKLELHEIYYICSDDTVSYMKYLILQLCE